jgi:hypothetical protein
LPTAGELAKRRGRALASRVIIMKLVIEIIQTAGLFCLFHFIAGPIVNGKTKNSWIKLPVFLILAVPSALLIAWMEYVPFLLLLIWASFNYHGMKVIGELEWQVEAGFRPRMLLFWVSSYSYVFLTCILGWILQIQVITERGNVPLWRNLIESSALAQTINLPLGLIISYTVFSFFLYYQRLHVKIFQGSSEAFGAMLGLFALVGTIYGLGFLVYWGYKISWIQSGILLAIAYAIKLVWFLIEAKLGLRDSNWIFILSHYCPVKSRTESTGFGWRLNLSGSQMPPGPVKCALFQKA